MREMQWVGFYVVSVILGWLLLLRLLRSTLPPTQNRSDTVMEWTIAGCASLLGPVTVMVTLGAMVWIWFRGDRE